MHACTHTGTLAVTCCSFSAYCALLTFHPTMPYCRESACIAACINGWSMKDLWLASRKKMTPEEGLEQTTLEIALTHAHTHTATLEPKQNKKVGRTGIRTPDLLHPKQESCP